jgi:hypothetical protein
LKNFIKKNCLTPRISLKIYIDNKKKELNLIDYNYNIIHIRMGDSYIVDKEILNNINKINFIKYWIEKNIYDKENYIIISDSCETENMFKLIGYKTLGLTKVHLGHHNINKLGVSDTLIEFFIMSTCKKIFQFSTYDWGSGFSDTINKIYDVPIEHNKIN